MRGTILRCGNKKKWCRLVSSKLKQMTHDDFLAGSNIPCDASTSLNEILMKFFTLIYVFLSLLKQFHN